MNDKLVSNNPIKPDEQKSPEPKQCDHKPKITPPPGMITRNVGDSKYESND